jgi:hypothetical protein
MRNSNNNNNKFNDVLPLKKRSSNKYGGVKIKFHASRISVLKEIERYTV